MTISTVPTETLKDFIKGQGYGVAPSAVVAICEQLLAVREAQSVPVAYMPKGSVRYLKGKNSGCWVYGEKINGDDEGLYTLPPGLAVTPEHQRVILMLLGVCGAAFELADDCCQQEVDGELCHVVPGDSFKKLSDALDEIENTLPDEYEDLPNTVLQWAAVPRHALRAMLQPVSQGYTLNSPVIPDGWKLMPVEITDQIGEAIAMEANCCGGIALDIYNAALAAAPTPTHE